MQEKVGPDSMIASGNRAAVLRCVFALLLCS
jgi:hypothetical protein